MIVRCSSKSSLASISFTLKRMLVEMFWAHSFKYVHKIFQKTSISNPMKRSCTFKRSLSLKETFKRTFCVYAVNSFQFNAPFLYPLAASPMVFLKFSEG